MLGVKLLTKESKIEVSIFKVGLVQCTILYNRNVDRALRIYLVTLVALTAIALSVVAIRRYGFHQVYPRNTLLFLPEMQYSDFTGAAVRVEHFGEPDMMTRREFGGQGYEVFPYPVPAVYSYLFFNKVFSNPLKAYLLAVLLSVFVAAGAFAVRLGRIAPRQKLPYVVVAVTLFTAFPLLYLLDRGNLEGLIWILLLLAIVCFYKKLYTATALLLAGAAAMKLFPALLFLLLLTRRKFWAFFAAILATAAFTLLAWTGVGPTIRQAALDSSKSGSMLKEQYIIGLRPLEIGWDHSLIAFAKQVAYLRFHLQHGSGGAPAGPIYIPGVSTAVIVYGVLSPLLFLLLYWFRLRTLPVLNQLISLLLLCILLPFVSNEYTLVHAYLAWGAFTLFVFQDLRTGNVKIPLWVPAAVLICFAVIFSPQSYWVIGQVSNLGGQLKMLALVILLFIVVKIPMPSSALGDLGSVRPA